MAKTKARTTTLDIEDIYKKVSILGEGDPTTEEPTTEEPTTEEPTTEEPTTEEPTLYGGVELKDHLRLRLLGYR